MIGSSFDNSALDSSSPHGSTVLSSAISSNSSALDEKHEISIGRLLDYGGVIGDGLLDSLLGAGGVLFGATSGSSSLLGSSLGRSLDYGGGVANSGHGSSPLSSALDDLGSLPLGMTLSTALDGHSRFDSAKVVAMFPMGHDEDENEEGGGDEDNDEDEEPGPKAMPSPGAMQPGVALVEAAATTSPMARALYRLQRLLN